MDYETIEYCAEGQEGTALMTQSINYTDAKNVT